jgi:glycosyltransferase involved in cell wall biosynthesis
MSTNKNTILIFVDWFSPAYLAGGPVQSVVSLVENLHNDFNFNIVTGNTDLDNIPFKNIKPNTWLEYRPNINVIYLDRSNISRDQLAHLLTETEFDLVYINSFLSKYFSIFPLHLLNKLHPTKPVLLAPRGMLGAGALSIKPLKKRLFNFFSKIRQLHNRVIWHATSEQEKKEILTVYKNAKKVEVVANIPKTINANASRLKKGNELAVCFISRISPKKNLLMALECLKKCTKSEISFNIYGPIEDKEYWVKCERAIEDLPRNVRTTYLGVLQPENIQGAYSKHHVFLLPTLNENFGHSIVESLQSGCPVIISDQTPWTDLQQKNAGYSIPLSSPMEFTRAIESFALLDQNEYDQKSRAAIIYIREKLQIQKTIDHYKKIFNDCIKN